jgi:dTMP kinase
MMPIAKNNKPLFVSVEGIDGVGKSTLIDGLRDKLRDEGLETAVYKVPGKDESRTSKFMRHLFKHELYAQTVPKFAPQIHILMVYLATSKVENQLQKIISEKNIDIIIADRSAVSNYVYAQADVGTLRERFVHKLMNFLFKDVMLPQLSFYIHADIETVVSRIKSRGEPISEREVKRLASLQERYDNIFNKPELYELLRDTKVVVIDGNKSKEEVLSVAFRELKRGISEVK